MNRILSVNKKHPLLNHDTIDCVAPHRQLILEPELFKVMQTSAAVGCASKIGLHAPEGMETAIGPSKKLAEVVEHDNPTQRRRQSGNQQSVIAARDMP